MAADYSGRRQTFQALHERGCFVMPNPWDPGSARYLHSLGFQALATTSAGFAFSRGLPDSSRAVPVDAVLGHIADIVNAVDLPVNADFEAGYSDSPDGVAVNVRRCVATGVAGLSIEDATGDRARPLYELPAAVERIKGARAAIDESGTGVQLTARAECFLVGHADPWNDRRLNAYAAAGAGMLFAPGIHQRDDIRTLTAALEQKPVNVPSVGTWLTAADRRVVPPVLLRRVHPVHGGAKDVASEGFTSLEGIASFADHPFRNAFETGDHYV